MAVDHYLSISEVSFSTYKEKGSKFLAFAHPLCQETEVKLLVDKYRKDYSDARHVCHAYSYGFENEVLKSSDSGEPSGTAGLPILNQIRSSGFKNVLVVVVRYFGGTKLGASGLATAYKTAAMQALENAERIEKSITAEVELTFPYPKMNAVMKLVKEMEGSVLQQNFTDHTYTMRVAVLRSKKEELVRNSS